MTSIRSRGARLTQQTLSETNAYLQELYKNINGTRAQDLPEWREMYVALTNDSILEDPEYGLGPRNLETNLQRLKAQANNSDNDISELIELMAENTQADAERTKSLNLVLERLATIDSNIKSLNTVVAAKFKAVDKKLTDYEGRITGVENRMKTAEIDLDSFRGDFVEYKQRVTNIENILRRYDLATMHHDIQDLKEVASNHDERLIDLQGRVQINAVDISTNRSDLLDAERELSGVSSEVGTLKAAVDEVFIRLERCGCM